MILWGTPAILPPLGSRLVECRFDPLPYPSIGLAFDASPAATEKYIIVNQPIFNALHGADARAKPEHIGSDVGSFVADSARVNHGPCRLARCRRWIATYSLGRSSSQHLFRSAGGIAGDPCDVQRPTGRGHHVERTRGLTRGDQPLMDCDKRPFLLQLHDRVLDD